MSSPKPQPSQNKNRHLQHSFYTQRVVFSPTKPTLNPKEVSYTPEKLYENFIFKEVSTNKRKQEERHLIRLKEGQSLMQTQKISQLETQLKVLRQTTGQQIEMYKNMIKDLEIEKKKHIQRLQEEFRLEIKAILDSHEEVAKVQQAKREELEAKILELQAVNSQTLSQHRGAQSVILQLKSKIDSLNAQLAHSRDLRSQAEKTHKNQSEQAKAELEDLRKTWANEKQVLVNRYQAQLADKDRHIHSLASSHKLQCEKREHQKKAELTKMDSKIQSLTADYQAERQGMEEQLNIKTSANIKLEDDLVKQRDKLRRVTQYFETELAASVEENELLRMELRKGGDLVNSLQIQRTGTTRDNQQLSEQVHRLREVLVESSQEIDKCRRQFVRLEGERERLKRLTTQQEVSVKQLTAMLTQKEQEARNWMENYFALKARF